MNNLSSVFLTSLTSADTSVESRLVSLASCPECGVLCLKSREHHNCLTYSKSVVFVKNFF
ncbi:MAG: hypothetical protein LBQ31_00170 [Bacteroidales bacterium]|nr:hypothetical protein [Bacteroidales bacterium]